MLPSKPKIAETLTLTPDQLSGARPRPGVPSGFNTQTGEIRSRGIEVSAVAKVWDNLSLVGGYTYTHAEITKSENNDVGNVPYGTPRHAASLWTDYAFAEGPLSGPRISVGARYVSKTYDISNTIEVPSANSALWIKNGKGSGSA
ncbi:TonB-dependent receptor domain-containing protein [Pseudochelatococcus sp. B33]